MLLKYKLTWFCLVITNLFWCILEYREVLKQEGVEDPILFAPGFVAQGGPISEAGKAAGDHWRAITGRALTEAKDVAAIRAAAKELTSQLY